MKSMRGYSLLALRSGENTRDKSKSHKEISGEIILSMHSEHLLAYLNVVG